MRHRQQKQRSVHDRTPNPPGRKPTGPKSARPGYPAIFFGQAAATKTLVEIASRQPVVIEQLPERKNVTPQNLGFTIRRFIATGLVRRLHRAEHPKRYDLVINDDYALARAVKAVLVSIAQQNQLEWASGKIPEDSVTVAEKPSVKNLRIFGCEPRDVEILLGSRQRTLAVLIVGTLGAVDASTVATIANVAFDGDMHRLMDPIEADGLFSSLMVGSIRLYYFTPGLWVEPLQRLVRSILIQNPQLASRIAPARRLLLHGGISNRTHLRRWLGLE